jgi:dimethylargininase
MTIAITRHISPRFNECELTHIDRAPIDLDIANVQHLGYVQALKELGCATLELPSVQDLPDSVFVEDTAVILPDVALLTRPGADSRKPEVDSISWALTPYRTLVRITPPATVDGGDVLVLGKEIYVGQSTRSNQAAVDQMNQLLGPYGYHVTGVELKDCLHLKSAVTRLDDATLLINRRWVDVEIFEGWDMIDIDPSEPYAANCLAVNGAVIYPTAFPKTRKLLEERGFQVKAIPVDELAKAEGAVTCCSLIVE